MKTAAAVALLLLSSAVRVQDPDEESKLIHEASRRTEEGLWQEAERLYKTLIEKHPSSARMEDLLLSLARINHHQKRDGKESRRLYALLLEKFPRSARAWEYRLEAADTWLAQDLVGRALDAFREIVDETESAIVRTRAMLKIWEIKGKQLQLRVNQCFIPGEKPEVHVYRRDVKQITYRAYRVKDEAAMAYVVGGPAEAGKDAIVRIKEWTEQYPLERDSDKVEIPATERGIYILEAEHERAIQSVTAYIGRFGIVAKSAAQKLVCFVQDRTTFKPVEGASIRVVGDERPFLGKTDARGLFVTMGYRGGMIVGEKDGEVFFAQSDGYEQPSTHQTYIVTDRPIYRPRQKVHFRVVHRDERGRELSVNSGLKVVVWITYQWQHEVYRKTHTLNEFGSAEGEFLLGDTPYLGEYTIHCQPESAPDEGGWDYGYGANRVKFRVDEYRKPEFKVQVDFKKPHFIRGEKIEGTGKAEYYFGGPVAEASVSYKVFFRPYDWGWRSWAWYYDWYSEEEDGFELRRGDWLGDEVLSDSGKTGNDGTFAFDFDNFIEKDIDGVFTVVAEVTDLSRRIVSGAGSCRVAIAEFGLSMSLNKYVFKRGDPVRAKVRAMTLEEKPVAGTKIVLRAFDQKWNGNGYDRTQVFEGSSITDASGLAEFSCTEDVVQGYLLLEAEAQDAKARVVKTSGHAWRTSDDGWNDPMEWEAVDVILDKKTYDLGETARLLVSSEHKNATFLFTVEGSEVYHQQVVTLKGHTAVVDYRIERPELAPNVYVTFTGLRNRDVLTASKKLIVNPAHRFLTVEITPDRTEYRPRQKARYELRTLGADGTPVAAEVMVGIVDDSIYGLQEEYVEDIRKTFLHRRWNEVSTATSMHYYFTGAVGGGGSGPLVGATFSLTEESRSPSTLAVGTAIMSMDDESGGGGTKFAATEIRSRFADTMLWKTVTTDAQGKAALEVDLADNVTTWRATARAHTRDSRFGQETNSVLSRKNIIVRVETPRFLTQNDDAVLSAVVHNNFKEEKELRIEFAAGGVEADGPRASVVRIAAGGRRRLDWKCRARTAGTAKITAKALGTEDSDAMEVTLPVLPHGLLRTDGTAGIASGRVTEKVVLPAEIVPGSAELTVTLSPVHASMVLDSLDSLAGYPYGCVEQTMSRFLPTVVVSRALSKLGLSKPKLEAQLPLMVSSGFQRLRSLQNDDGGWGWWGHGDANGWVTAYVVSGLALAHEAGYSGNEDMLDRGLDVLWRVIGKSEDVDEQAYVLSALSAGLQSRRNRTGIRTDLLYPVASHEDRTKEYEEIRDRLAVRAAQMKPYGRALMAVVLHRDGKDPKPVLAELARGIRDQGTHARVDDGDRHRWVDDGTEATAMALQAFVRIDPRHPLVVKLANGLSMARRGSWWVSTRQTAMAVYALVDYLALTGDLNPDLTLTLTVNGEKLLGERVTKANWSAFDGVRKIPASKLKPGANEIVIEQAGSGTPSYSVALRYHVPAENISASKGAIRVERRYSRIHREGGKRVLVPLGDGEAVESGEEIEVTLHLESDAVHEWLMLEDPLPAGFEPVREYWGYYGWEWDYWYDHKEFHDQHVSVAMSSLGKGRKVSYTMRAETPGDFHAMPARVFNMYRPEIGGHSAEGRVKVVERK